MKELFIVEWKRLFRSHILQLCIILLVLIGLLGVILNHIYYDNQKDSRFIIYGLYNTYTQFSYLIMGFILVSIFAKDYQNGVYTWYRQMGHSLIQILCVKILVVLIIILPLLNVIFILAQLISNNTNWGYFMMCLISVNISTFYIILLALTVSVLIKKVIKASLIMYGLFILFNALNLVCCGLFNPSDANSIQAYYLGKLINSGQTHYSLDKLALSLEYIKWGAFGMLFVSPLILAVIIMCFSWKERK